LDISFIKKAASLLHKNLEMDCYLFVKKHSWLLVSAALGSLLTLIFVKFWDLTKTEYIHANIKRELSPDRVYVALLDENIVEPPFGGASIDESVSLWMTDHPDQVTSLIWVDTGGDAEERPRIGWSSANILKVTVSRLDDLKVLTLHAQGVEVDLHLDPDDPPAVTAWLREKGLLSEATGDATTR
jgi:hypothetical protein